MLLAVFVLALGCDAPVAGEDASSPLDASADAGLDASGPTDGGGPTDAATDGGRDASDARPPVDARIDSDPEAARAFLDAVCGPLGEAWCTVPWSCGCETTPAPDPLECVPERTAACEAGFFDLASILALDGRRTIDRDMVEDCAATLRASFAACVTPPGDLEDLYACLHMMRAELPIGEYCTTGGLCAAGTGFCRAGERCRAIPTTAGAACTTRCGASLACVGGTCSAPVAEGGACADHEDCAAPHLCTGGTCGPPAAAGGACASDERCAVGLVCADASCAPAETTCSPFVGSCAHGLECVGEREARCRRAPAGRLHLRRRRVLRRGHLLRLLGLRARLHDPPRPRRALHVGRVRRRARVRVLPGPRRLVLRGSRAARGVVLRAHVRARPQLHRRRVRDRPRAGRALQRSLPTRSDVRLRHLHLRNRRGRGRDLRRRRHLPRLCARPVLLLRRHRGRALPRLPAAGELCDDSGACLEPAACVYVEATGHSECQPPAGSGELCFAACTSSDEYCGEDPDRGECRAAICSELGGGGRDPVPLPLPVPVP
ncbi:MAG: hypothetical protein M5U28_16625 [Sandaracinaceae bacterium]|nr:hypothetical protein [Sandaracinaceae bacterium]